VCICFRSRREKEERVAEALAVEARRLVEARRQRASRFRRNLQRWLVT